MVVVFLRQLHWSRVTLLGVHSDLHGSTPGYRRADPHPYPHTHGYPLSWVPSMGVRVYPWLLTCVMCQRCHDAMALAIGITTVSSHAPSIGVSSVVIVSCMRRPLACRRHHHRVVCCALSSSWRHTGTGQLCHSGGVMCVICWHVVVVCCVLVWHRCHASCVIVVVIVIAVWWQWQRRCRCRCGTGHAHLVIVVIAITVWW